MNDLDPGHVLPLQEFPDLRVDFPVLHLREVVVPFGKQPEPQVREVLAEAGQVARRQGVVIDPPHDERGHGSDDGLGALGDGLAEKDRATSERGWLSLKGGLTSLAR